MNATTIAILIISHPPIETPILDGCGSVTDAAVKCIAEGLQLLKSLSIQSCDRLTSLAAGYIGNSRLAELHADIWPSLDSRRVLTKTVQILAVRPGVAPQIDHRGIIYMAR